MCHFVTCLVGGVLRDFFVCLGSRKVEKHCIKQTIATEKQYIINVWN